jgi:hypothetical protein
VGDLTHEDCRKCLLEHQPLDEKALFRLGGLELTQRFQEPSGTDFRLTYNERLRRVTQLDVPIIGRRGEIELNVLEHTPPLRLEVGDFEPVDGDRLDKRLGEENGHPMSVRLPTYALVNVKESVERFKTHVSSNYMTWAEAAGGPFLAIVKFLKSEEDSPEHREYLDHVLFFCHAVCGL